MSPISISLNRKSNFHQTEIIERDYDKVFVIGFNKTGTTTLKKVLGLFGFKVGNQSVSEILAVECLQTGDMSKIMNYCYTAEVFQDQPFSSPHFYKELDKEFPNSKFILSIRDDENQWFNSLVKFHSKKFSSDPSRPPNEADLVNSIYRYKGWLLDIKKVNYNYPKVPLYNKEHYIDTYLNHNNDVETYFKDRPNDFLKINVSNSNDFLNLVTFLNIKTNMKKFPWKNKT